MTLSPNQLFFASSIVFLFGFGFFIMKKFYTERIKKSETKNVELKNIISEFSDLRKIRDDISIDNVENVENVENGENVENVESVENLGNVENVEIVEIVENVEIVESDVDSESQEIVEVLDLSDVNSVTTDIDSMIPSSVSVEEIEEVEVNAECVVDAETTVEEVNDVAFMEQSNKLKILSISELKILLKKNKIKGITGKNKNQLINMCIINSLIL